MQIQECRDRAGVAFTHLFIILRSPLVRHSQPFIPWSKCIRLVKEVCDIVPKKTEVDCEIEVWIDDPVDPLWLVCQPNRVTEAISGVL